MRSADELRWRGALRAAVGVSLPSSTLFPNVGPR